MKRKYESPQSQTILFYPEAPILEASGGDGPKANDFHSEMEQMSNSHVWGSENWEE